ncbi:hypothetical protein K2173_008533 [Erythroxylum novogranatense]|uniref:BAG family molecular chaperone regulator 7 n=1 Tax=Erythroxylum novogranatense TaxID=1862640 RepID=A0AAV8SL63_9ROSI|nr:hypothetical protein K2173_008533 [Erythroxylum novogranatense]
MSRFRRMEIYEPDFASSLFLKEASFFTPKTLSFPSFWDEEAAAAECFSSALDLLNPNPFSLLDEKVTDLIHIGRTTSFYSPRRIHNDLWLQSLCDRVSALESKFDYLVKPKTEVGDRKYTVTAEIHGPVERKYKWTADIKDGKKEMKAGTEKKYKWTAEIKGEDAISRKYTIEASTGHAGGGSGSAEKKEKKSKKEKKAESSGSSEEKKKKVESGARLVEIEEPNDHGALVLRQAFGRRLRVARASKGKQKELSVQDAALLIQMSFRAYLIRRSKALRALRELAIAKSKLKEIRASFNNFSYRRQVARDAEERQRFSEKIIVLLLTVDAIEGADILVRAAKRSMVDELEAMLDVIDPQPPGKTLSIRRRTFDMPDGVIRKELAEGVAHVVQMLDNEENGTFEACL